MEQRKNLRRPVKMLARLLILSQITLILLDSGNEKSWQRSRSATTNPTPYPTPNYDPDSYIPPIRAGKTLTVSGENLADRIQEAQNDPSVVTVKIEGGGSISK